MSDQDFTFQIKGDASQALAASDAVDGALAKNQTSAAKTGAAINEAFQDKNGRWRDAEGRFLAMGTQIQQVGDKMIVTGQKGAAAAKNVGDAAADASSHVGELIALAAAYISGHELMELADGYTEISNKLRVVSKDQENFNGLMEATLGIAQDTRTSWEDVTSTYQRLANVTRGLGLSQEQVLDLTEEMAKGAKISGASTQETSAAMSELTHAFATGTMQGREFRVLMRDVPQLMHELQVASGKTGAEFAEMGKHSQITGKLLIDWFGKASDDINSKFGQTIPTIAEEFTMLHNAAEQFFGETATGTGVLEGIRSVINFVIQNFETFGKILIGVGTAVVGLYAISKVISLIQTLSAAIAANPFMALITAITIAVSLLHQFGDVISIDSTGVAKMSDVLAVLWGYIKNIATTVADFVENTWKSFHDAISEGVDSTGIEVSLKNIMLLIASFVDAAIAAFKILGHAIAGAMSTALLGIAEGFQSLINSVIDGVNKVRSIAFDLLNNTAQKRLDAANGAHTGMQAWEAAGGVDRLMDQSRVGQGGLVDKDLFKQKYDAEYKAISAAENAKQGLDDNGNDLRNSQIGHVDLVAAGSASAAWKAMKEDMKQDLQTDVTKDLVTRFFDDVEKHAKDRVANAKPPPGDYIDKTTTTPEAPPEDEKAIKAMEKLFKELRGVVEESNPVAEAQQKIAAAQDVVTKAMTSSSPKIAGLLAQYGGGVAIMDAFKKKLDDQLHPFDALVTKMTEEAAILRESTEAQKQAADVEKARDDLKKKGIEATQAQINEIVRLSNVIETQKQLNKDETEAYTKLFGAAKTYHDELLGLDALYQHGKINVDQYNDALDNARQTYLEGSADGKTIAGGMERAWLQIKLDVQDVGSVIKTTFIDAFNSVENALVDLVTKGAVDWHSMVEQMLADLTRLLERQALLALLGGIGGGGAAAGSLASMPGIANPWPTAAGGNQWTVGGSGAQDSQLVAFRASPGERVTVDHGPHTGGRLGDDGSSMSRGGPVSIHVLNDPRSIVAALGTAEAQQVILSTYQKADRYKKHR